MFVLIRSSLYPCGSRPLQMFASAFTLMCVLFLESSMHCFFPSFSLGWFSLVKVFPLKNNYFPYTSVTSPLSVAHPNSLCYNFLPLSPTLDLGLLNHTLNWLSLSLLAVSACLSRLSVFLINLIEMVHLRSKGRREEEWGFCGSILISNEENWISVVLVL